MFKTQTVKNPFKLIQTVGHQNTFFFFLTIRLIMIFIKSINQLIKISYNLLRVKWKRIQFE